MKRCGCVLSIIVFLGFLQALLVPKYMEHNPEGALISEYYANAGNNDVIFIGDCEVYENFSPITLWEEYGITSCIRGSPQQMIWQSCSIAVFTKVSGDTSVPKSITSKPYGGTIVLIASANVFWCTIFPGSIAYTPSFKIVDGGFT